MPRRLESANWLRPTAAMTSSTGVCMFTLGKVAYDS